jgi:hypothetical protein
MSDAKMQPSKGSWGWFGTHSKSQIGKQRRGLIPDEDDKTLFNEANDQLATLKEKYNKLTSGENIYDYVKKVESSEATMVAEEGMEEIAAVDSASGFSGGGSGGTSRRRLLKRLQGSVGRIMKQQDAEKRSTLDSITGNMQEIISTAKASAAASGDLYNVDDYMDTDVPGGHSTRTTPGSQVEDE